MCWVKIQERNNAEIFKIDHSSYFWVKFPGGSSVLTKTPPPTSGLAFVTVLLGCTDLLYCTVLLYCLIRIFFFPRFIAIFFGAKYPHTPSLDKLLCQIFICTEFCEVSFFFFPSYIVLRDTVSKIRLHSIRICFVLIIHKQLYNFLCLREMVPFRPSWRPDQRKGTSQFKGNNWEWLQPAV